MVARAIFVLLSALAGMALFLRAQDPSQGFLLVGLGMGAVAGGLILAGEYALRRLSFGIIVGGAVGLAGGLVLTGLVEWVGSAVFDVELADGRPGLVIKIYPDTLQWKMKKDEEAFYLLSELNWRDWKKEKELKLVTN